jgi:hypothetical protein
MSPYAGFYKITRLRDMSQGRAVVDQMLAERHQGRGSIALIAMNPVSFDSTVAPPTTS